MTLTKTKLADSHFEKVSLNKREAKDTPRFAGFRFLQANILETS